LQALEVERAAREGFLKDAAATQAVNAELRQSLDKVTRELELANKVGSAYHSMHMP
jgi:hypothetical protein